MAVQPHQIKSASVTLNTKGQTLESLQQVVGGIVGRAGCGRCGRIAFLRVDFLSDPPPEMTKEGVISFMVE